MICLTHVKGNNITTIQESMSYVPFIKPNDQSWLQSSLSLLTQFRCFSSSKIDFWFLNLITILSPKLYMTPRFIYHSLNLISIFHFGIPKFCSVPFMYHIKLDIQLKMYCQRQIKTPRLNPNKDKLFVNNQLIVKNNYPYYPNEMTIC